MNDEEKTLRLQELDTRERNVDNVVQHMLDIIHKIHHGKLDFDVDQKRQSIKEFLLTELDKERSKINDVQS